MKGNVVVFFFSHFPENHPTLSASEAPFVAAADMFVVGPYGKLARPNFVVAGMSPAPTQGPDPQGLCLEAISPVLRVISSLYSRMAGKAFPKVL